MGKQVSDKEFDEMMAALNDLIGCLDSRNNIMKTIEKSGGFFITSHTEFNSRREDTIKSDIGKDSWEFEETSDIIPYYDERCNSPIGKHSNVHAFNTDKALYVGVGLDSAKELAEKAISDGKEVMIIGSEVVSENMKKYNSLRGKVWCNTNEKEAANAFFELLDEKDIVAVFDMADDDFKRISDKFYNKLDRIESIRMRKLHLEGDIIITDPCYIIKRRDESTRPKWDEFHQYKSMRDYPDYDEVKDSSKQFLEDSDRMDIATRKWEMEHPDDHDSWSDYDLSHFGINNFIAHRTLVGDWSCATIDKDDNIIGHFCADGGEVGVFLLDEVLAYNPGFNYHETKDWTTTLIKNFKGDVWFEILDKETLIVRGEGNVTFRTAMTGF